MVAKSLMTLKIPFSYECEVEGVIERLKGSHLFFSQIERFSNLEKVKSPV